MKRKLLFASAALALGLGGTFALARSAITAGPAIPFDELSLTLEINSTDSDAGILFFSDVDEQLEHLMIQNPMGQTVFELTSSDPLELGLTEIFWETAEPDITTALLAYPEGDYMVTGVAFDGTVVTGVAKLSHDVPEPPVITAPEPGAELDIEGGLLVAWELDPSVDHYWLELEVDGLEFENVIQLRPGISAFRISPALLLPGAEIKIGLAAMNEDGNVTVTEIEVESLSDLGRSRALPTRER